MTRPAAAGGGTIEVFAESAIVHFQDNVPLRDRQIAVQSVGSTLGDEILPGWHEVDLPVGMPVADGLAFLRGAPGVALAQPNNAYRPSRVPNDPSVFSQYHLSNVNAFSAWEYNVGASNQTTIVVADTGIEGTHPDLAAKFGAPVAGLSRDCSNAACTATCQTGGCIGLNEPLAACNHGTRVAGVAAAATNNGVGVAGISWGASLVSVKIFPNSGCNADCTDVSAVLKCEASTAAIVRAINYARGLQGGAAGNVVLNMSIGQAGAACDAGIQAAIDAAPAGTSIPITISAGNNGGDVNNPGNCNDGTNGVAVIPVGATDANNNIASFSSRGAKLAANGVVAPGVSIVTTDIGGGTTGGATGTSFSSPLVAGIAALIWSAKPAFTAAQVKSTLRGSTDNIGVAALDLGPGVHPLGDSAGSGRVNAFLAMRLAINGTTAFAGTSKAIAFPNPFKPSESGIVAITIPQDLQGQNATIKIYTQQGRLVKTIRGLTWDGKNDEGKAVATGTYIFLVSTDKGTTTGRMAVTR